jgi:hypothetical protein
MTVFSISYEATLIFIAQKILRKFSNILWIMPHLPMQKYAIVIWKISAGKIFLLLVRNGAL